MREIWKPVVGLEDCYMVSNMGRVKSVDRVYYRTNGIRDTKRGKLMKTYVNEHGYVCVRLSRKKRSRIYKVHRLMMIAFVGLDPNRPIVNHKDGNKRHNVLSNLEWSTSAENNDHAVQTGLRDPSSKRKEIHAVIDDLDVIIKGALQLAMILHLNGYFIDVSDENLSAAISRCAKHHRLYMGRLKVEYTDDPYDIPKTYNWCGIKGRVIHTRLTCGWVVNAKGPSGLYDLMYRLGHWRNKDRDAQIKLISEAALKHHLCDGYKIWYD